MSVFVVTDLADKDIRQAAEYIDGESGSLEAGNKLIVRLNQAFARIAAGPYTGRPRPELEPDLRGYPFEQYTIFYNIYPEFVEIRRVIHQRRDVKRESGSSKRKPAAWMPRGRLRFADLARFRTAPRGGSGG